MNKLAQNDQTKPSRLNRRRKKKWKISALALTVQAFNSMLLLTGLASQNIGVMRRLIAVFLRAIIYPSCYGGIGKALAKVAGPMSCTPTLFILPPSIGVFVGRFKICYIGAKKMNNHSNGHQSAQNTTKTALFSIFLHRQTICQNVTGALAMRFKRRYPSSIVKFSGFERGAL